MREITRAAQAQGMEVTSEALWFEVRDGKAYVKECAGAVEIRDDGIYVREMVDVENSGDLDAEVSVSSHLITDLTVRDGMGAAVGVLAALDGVAVYEQCAEAELSAIPAITADLGVEE